ncbi:MAG: HAMP domain-containing protein [Solirubrobacterales bacterium]|nr:HAMP domain-containing protein [Solirubrobacterales bacterium]
MAAAAITYLYRRLGGRYPLVFVAVALQSALFIVAGTLALFSFYYDVSLGEFMVVLAIGLVLCEAAVSAAVIRALPRLRVLGRWIDGRRDPRSTEEAWAAAVGLPLYLIKRALPLPVLVSALPTCIVGIAILGLAWVAIFPLLAAAVIAIGYSAMLHYLYVEAGMRPVLLEIGSSRSPGTVSADFWAVPLGMRLLVALPLVNLVTGLVVAALTSNGGGAADLGLDVVVTLLVATTISLELTVLLSKSILRPLKDLQRAVRRVGEGDYEVAVPVTTGDEIGELAASFNEMVEGLSERKRIRAAFGTYLDEEVAEYILSEGFSEQGVELEVSMLFCDVRDFTEFASDATPQEVVAALNRLFEVIVPIVARHGGHVDKFEGDGLLAVFGAPEMYRDHADRAVGAACEVGAAVNDEARAGKLRIGIGVNTGRVVAGAIGGAGRLNFSVIGGAVNIASRVEARTRETDDEILITAQTRRRLSARFEAESRGTVRLRGIAEPVELYAPMLAGRPARPAEPVAPDADRDEAVVPDARRDDAVVPRP